MQLLKFLSEKSFQECEKCLIKYWNKKKVDHKVYKYDLNYVKKHVCREKATRKQENINCTFFWAAACSVLPFILRGFPSGSDSKEYTWHMGDLGSTPGLRRSPVEGKRLPTPVFWPGEFYGQRSLAGYSPCVGKSWTWLSDSHTFIFKKLYWVILISVHGHA